MKKLFKTSGMHCKSCSMLISDSVSDVKGVKSVKADFSKNEVEVDFSPPASESEIKKAIEKEGYKVLT